MSACLCSPSCTARYTGYTVHVYSARLVVKPGIPGIQCLFTVFLLCSFTVQGTCFFIVQDYVTISLHELPKPMPVPRPIPLFTHKYNVFVDCGVALELLLEATQCMDENS